MAISSNDGSDRIALPESGKMKDFFLPAVVEDLAERVAATGIAFDKAGFLAHVLPDLETLEYSGRLNLIVDGFDATVDADFEVLVEALQKALGPEPETEFGEFMFLPFLNLIPVRGLGDPVKGLQALMVMTRWFSAEFSVRPFLDADPMGALKTLSEAAHHPSPEVRRLASEGTRPRLLWGLRLIAFVNDPTPLFPVLSALYADPDAAVRRSVANSLNDITKDHPGKVLDLLGEWRDQGKLGEEFDGFARHAMRGLIKDGDERALLVLGYRRDLSLASATIELSANTASLGDSLTITVDVTLAGSEPAPAIIDYVVHHQRADGTLSPKVFKLTDRRLEPGVPLTLSKKHSLKPVTTRKYYAGLHEIELQVNGVPVAKQELTLNV